MVAVAVGLGFAGYTIGLWGYCLVRGYDVSFRDMFRTRWQGAQVIPSKGHKLGTIITSTGTSNPGQQLGP
jgi:hypothetical protein